jgi:hypothetical protein
LSLELAPPLYQPKNLYRPTIPFLFLCLSSLQCGRKRLAYCVRAGGTQILRIPKNPPNILLKKSLKQFRIIPVCLTTWILGRRWYDRNIPLEHTGTYHPAICPEKQELEK